MLKNWVSKITLNIGGSKELCVDVKSDDVGCEICENFKQRVGVQIYFKTELQ